MPQSPVKTMLDAAFGRQQPGSAGGTDAAVLHAIAEAAPTWWMVRRPDGWSLEQYLAAPTAGCGGTVREQALAQAVAGWIRQGG